MLLSVPNFMTYFFYVLESRLNVAFMQPTAQQSTQYGAVSSLAVDGNEGTNFHNGECMHTYAGPDVWWAVQLPRVLCHMEVYITNRDDFGKCGTCW